MKLLEITSRHPALAALLAATILPPVSVNGFIFGDCIAISFALDFATMMLDGRLGIGVLGCSDIARRKFLPALGRSRRAVLAAVSSSSPEKAALVAAGYGCKSLSHEALLSCPSVHLVYLSLPNHLHEEWSIRVLESGKHLICEKPLAPDRAAVDRILSCAAGTKRLVYENQMFLFHPQHEVVKSLIAQGRVGAVKGLRCFFGFPLPALGNYRLDPKQGGGAFLDLARYPIGAALHLLTGRPERFRGHALWQGDLNMAVHGAAMTEEGQVLTFGIAFGQEYESYYEVIGESGKIFLDRAFTTPPDLANRVILTTRGNTTQFQVPPADHFQLMIDRIAEIVLSGRGYGDCSRRADLVAAIAADMAEGCGVLGQG